ncbi:MAG: helix-turn-helix transcriptional regulator [Clostridia bacterium]|nr:helix-turn-helix transcriptional regulator [Clostridia bacterium]
MEIKNAIAALRQKHGLTQDELAEKLFVTRQAVSRWETDETTPSADTLMELSKLFGVSINALLGTPGEWCDETPVPEDVLVARLIREFNSLGIEDMHEVAELHKLPGDYINLESRLPNGQIARILDDSKMYYGNQICRPGSDRCYGLAADETQLAVFEYGNNGSDSVLVVWKRL